jgi:hypothetical protein
MRHWKKREEDDEWTSLISESSVLESHSCWAKGAFDFLAVTFLKLLFKKPQLTVVFPKSTVQPNRALIFLSQTSSFSPSMRNSLDICSSLANTLSCIILSHIFEGPYIWDSPSHVAGHWTRPRGLKAQSGRPITSWTYDGLSYCPIPKNWSRARGGLVGASPGRVQSPLRFSITCGLA